MLTGYQHPPTYHPTGDTAADFSCSSEVYDANLARYLPQDRGAPILDVGCGWGQFLWWLRQRGYTNARGIDLGADQERHCRALGLDVIQVGDSTAFLRDCSAQFEMITLHHVIEHMPAHEGLDFLRATRQSLCAGGLIVVQTPNMGAVSAGFARYIELTHATGYTENSLGEALGHAGFHVTAVFGGRTPVRARPRRLFLLGLQVACRLLWRIMLVSELGSDAPRVLQKNLFAVAYRPV
jgi:SAM-dependent methyltransferase